MSEQVSIALIGSRGRMGRALRHLIDGEFASSCRVLAEIHSSSSDSDWEDALTAEVWIDFSLPRGTPRLVHALESVPPGGGKVPAIVIGTTGHSTHERSLLEHLARRTLALHSSNFSTGVLALKKALEFISPFLASSGFRPLLVETHHVHKKDAPSGTALLLSSATAGMQAERIHSIRAGEVIGDHRVEFHGHGERIALEHHAQSREIFARGALDAALWLARKRRAEPGSCGWLTMDDLFEERLSCLK